MTRSVRDTTLDVLRELGTTTVFGNAVSALANAHASRVPLVVLVGQQDRRQFVSIPGFRRAVRAVSGDQSVKKAGGRCDCGSGD